MMEPRPSSVAEIARRTCAGRSFEFELSDFLHEFARQKDYGMLTEPPVLLGKLVRNGGIQDAYLAAVAASLAASLGRSAPPWVRDSERVLREPWFASPGRHMRALLLVESPAAFRERNLFVTANALSVA